MRLVTCVSAKGAANVGFRRKSYMGEEMSGAGWVAVCLSAAVGALALTMVITALRHGVVRHRHYFGPSLGVTKLRSITTRISRTGLPIS